MPLELNTQGVCCGNPLDNVPSLLFDFQTTKSLRPVMGEAPVTFSRAGLAAYQDKHGLLRFAAAAVPRFPYVDGVCSGLLLEQSATNLIPTSRDLSAANGWTVTGASDYNAAVPAPDGSIGAYRVRDVGPGDAHHAQFTHPASGDTSGTWSASLFVKYDDSDPEEPGVGLRLTLIGGTGGGQNFTANFNTQTGAVTNYDTDPALAYTVEPFADGWFRIGVTGASTSADHTSVRIRLYAGQDPTVGSLTTGGRGNHFVFGAQLEQNNLSSYIATDGSQATRAADDFQISAVDTQAWFNPSEWTEYLEWYATNQFITTGSATISQYEDAATNGGTEYSQFQIQADNGFRTLGREGGNAQWNQSSGVGALVSQGVNRAVAHVQTDSVRGRVNGVVLPLDPGVTVPAADRVEVIGRNGPIRKLAFFPVALDDAQMNALSTS